MPTFQALLEVVYPTQILASPFASKRETDLPRARANYNSDRAVQSTLATWGG
jgi:hypothetical protein